MYHELNLYAFPGNIEDDILDIGRRQVPYMRAEWFSQCYKYCSQAITTFSDCRNGKTLIFTMSGTAAMEAAILSFCSEGDNISINAGNFGRRWKEICDYHSLHCDEFLAHDYLDLYELDKKLASGKYKVLMMQHHETSTGELLDINAVGKLCNKHGVLFIVDGISSLFCEDISMDKDGIDVMICSSQKSLNIPPGLAFITLSESALNKIDKSTFYFDFESQLENLKRGQTPFSPATQLFLQLEARLKKINDESLENYKKSIRNKSLNFKERCKSIGLTINGKNRANLITAIVFDKDPKSLVDKLINNGIYVMPGGEIKNMIRVSHCGLQSECEINKLLNLIEQWNS